MNKARNVEVATQDPDFEPAHPSAGGVVDCLHCALPIPSSLRARGESFCCSGCARVHALLNAAGLTRYYDLRPDRGVPVATLRPDSYAWLDAQRGNAGPSGDRPASLSLDVQGIHCAACIWLLRELLQRKAGGIDLRLNPSLGQAELTFEPHRFDLRAYLREAETFGYRFGPRRKGGASISHGMLLRLGVSAAAAMNVMIFSICFYAGLGPSEASLYHLFGKLNLALTTLAVLVGGWVFVRAAAQGLRRGVVHLDLPIALGIVLAYAGSVYAYRHAGPEATYFDTVAAFITLMLVGRLLQERILERNRNSLLAGEGIENLHTRRFENGAVVSIPASSIQTGDELWIVPGDILPVEATLESASGAVSLDWITGESEVQSVLRADRIQAGAFNAGRTTLRVHAEQGFDCARLHELLRAPILAEQNDGGGAGARWWRRLGTVYVLGVLLLAIAGFVSWIPQGFEAAARVTVAILAITCPCAIGLGVPLAHEMVHLALRRQGIFLRRRGFLDRALGIRKVLFDKTGTLTLGELTLTEEAAASLQALAPADRRLLYRMAIRSNHPTSRSLARALSPLIGREPAVPATEIEADDAILETPGHGLAWSRIDGHYRLGRPGFALAAVAPDSAAEGRGPAAPSSGSADEGATIFSKDGRPLARFLFDEEVRSDARVEIERLLESGYQVHLLSGDTSAKTSRLAERVGIAPENALGDLSPEAKAARVRAITSHDTLMVGDGINDAMSFDAATCTATPAVDRPALPARADFYFLGEGIAAVRRALDAAHHLRAVTRANLLFALAYNAFALALCFAGWISPLMAAILMPASSLTVVGHTTWRLTGRRLSWMS
jgi:Cu2+-exporting ATPase